MYCKLFADGTSSLTNRSSAGARRPEDVYAEYHSSSFRHSDERRYQQTLRSSRYDPSTMQHIHSQGQSISPTKGPGNEDSGPSENPTQGEGDISDGADGTPKTETDYSDDDQDQDPDQDQEDPMEVTPKDEQGE